MSTPWKKRLQAAGEDLLNPTGSVQVLVDLKQGSADVPCLQRLEGLGLSVQSSAKTKIVGTIEGGQIAALRKDPQVREVEISSRLRPSSLESGRLLRPRK